VRLEQHLVTDRRPWGNRESGAAAVELALVLPMLLMLIFGIVDFGRAYNAKISLTQAAREGARAWSLGQGSLTQQRVWDASKPLTSAEVTVTPGLLNPDGTINAGAACPVDPSATDVAAVKATYTFRYITPVGALAGLATGPVILTGTGVMRCLG
jgi:Flp pilus assembly protein TadG